jgi:hypothetical protein
LSWLEVLQPYRSSGDDAAALVGDADLPHLLGSSLLNGAALTATVRVVIERRKSVLLLVPTAIWPRSATAVVAPTLAALSTAAV